MTDKTLLYFKTVVKNYDADYVFKIDDDIFFRLDRVPYVVRQWALQGSGEQSNFIQGSRVVNVVR